MYEVQEIDGVYAQNDNLNLEQVITNRVLISAWETYGYSEEIEINITIEEIHTEQMFENVNIFSFTAVAFLQVEDARDLYLI